MKKLNIFVCAFLASIVVSCTKKDMLSKSGSMDDRVTKNARSANAMSAETTSNVMVTTLAGAINDYGGDQDGTGANARFWWLLGITSDQAGNLYVADHIRKIKKVTPEGVVTTLPLKNEDSTLYANRVFGLAIDPSGSLVLGNSEKSVIQKANAAGYVSTIAGNGTSGYADGKGEKAQFTMSTSMVTGPGGNIFVVDRLNHRIRKITPSGVVTTFAGSGESVSRDGIGESAAFNWPFGITIDNEANLYVTEWGKVRKITPDGVVSTLVGSNELGDADGQGASAQFWELKGITIDQGGNLYVVDYGSYTNKIKKITPEGNVTTLAGSGGWWNYTEAFKDGPGATARFGNPTSIAIDPTGQILYVTDDHLLRKITGF